jgi:signal peptidase I
LTHIETSKVFAVELGEDRRLSSEAVRELLEAVLDHGKQFRFRAGGMSMFPFIRSGDVVTIAPLDREKPYLGDIVAFLHPSNRSLTLHRVIGVESQSYDIRGDNAMGSDGNIPVENILGRVVRVERNDRRVRLGTGPGGRVLAILSRRGILGKVISMTISTVAFIRSVLRPGQQVRKRVARDGDNDKSG